MPKTLEGLKGSSYPAIIWNKYMEEIHGLGMNKSFE